jgi:hypothetical protein
MNVSEQINSATNNLAENTESLPEVMKFTEEDYKKTDLIFGRYPHQRKLCDFTDLVQIDKEDAFKKVTILIPCDTREAELIFYQIDDREFIPQGEFLCGGGWWYGEYFNAWYAAKDGRFFTYRYFRRWSYGEKCWDKEGYSNITSCTPELFLSEHYKGKSTIIKEYKGAGK